ANILLSFGAGFASSSGTMAVDEGTSMNLDGVATPAIFHHAIDFGMNTLRLAPSFGYEVLPGFNIAAGFDIGYIVSTSFSAREEITQPVNRGVFEDNGLRTRDVYSGALTNVARIQTGLDVGGKYLLPMNARGTMSLAPSVSYYLGLTNLLQDVQW